MSVAGLIRYVWGVVCLLLLPAAYAAQNAGELTLTPSSTVSTVAGTGVRGLSGDGGPARGAQLAAPRGAAYDSAGNLYIADAGNHVVRKVTADGTVSTFAGTGIQGFDGDGSSATKAEFDSPSGVAVRPDGALYIADTGNRRIRVVGTDGVVTTFAGSGVRGSSGDEGPALLATFRRPISVAVNAAGEVFVADADDFRVRRIDSAGQIHAYAGKGKQGSAGVGGKAVDAELDDPSSLALDADGRLLIADRRNRRVLAVGSDGILKVVAAASAGHVDGVAVAQDGSILIANAGMHTVTRASETADGVEAGNGEQSLSADGTAAGAASFDRPVGLAAGQDGDAIVVDKGGRVSVIASPNVVFSPTAVGSSAMQSVTLTNTGSAGITVSGVSLPAGFALAGGTCGALPIALAVGQSCVATLSFTPKAGGAVSGTVQFAGTGFLSRSVHVRGTAIGSPALIATTTTVDVPGTLAQGTTMSLTAHVYAAGPGTPTGTVEFFDGASKLSSVTLSTGAAGYSMTGPAAGSHSFSASYLGDAQFAPSTSAPAVSVVGGPAQDFLVTAGTSSSADLVVAAGAPALFQFQVAAANGASAQTVTFSTTGAPSNVSIGFDPATVNTGPNAQTVLMTVKVLQTAKFRYQRLVVVALLFPIVLWPRRRWRMYGLGVLFLVTGCASGNRVGTTNAKPSHSR